MKKITFFLLCLAALAACERAVPTGQLRISFAETATDVTRTDLEIPDTSEFLLKVSDSQGEIVYEGAYGDSPELITVSPGTYTVRVVSDTFEKPAFSSPQFGDEQCVIVPEQTAVSVRLQCIQLNAGVRLKIDQGFLTSYPSASLMLKSDNGSLLYSYKEKRVAYFKPGNVSLVMSQEGKDEILMTRRLEAQEILTLSVKVMTETEDSQQTASGLSIGIDTTRFWLDETYILGGRNGKGESASQALTVSQAKASIGEYDIWVSGYVVGGDLTSTAASFDAPFSSTTNLLLGSRTSVTDRDACIAVQLTAGDVRENLNLVDNPDLLGKKISVRGNIVESYFGLIGLKEVSDYKIL